MSLVVILVLRIYVLLGGFLGADGYVTSAGTSGLAAILKSTFPDAVVNTYSWNLYKAVADDMDKHRSDKIVAVGYSGGGSRITWLANLKSKPKIDLAVLYDPSPSWQMLPIGSNVKSAVTFENKRPLFFGFGGGVLKAKAGGPKIRRVSISESHVLVQVDQDLHRQTVNAIKQLAPSTEPPRRAPGKGAGPRPQPHSEPPPKPDSAPQPSVDSPSS